MGASPLQWSTLAAELLAGTERGPFSELARHARYMLPIPPDPSRQDCDQRTKDLGASRGGSLILGKAMMGAAAASIGATLQGDFSQSRLALEPDRNAADLRAHVAAHASMSMGCDPALVNPDPKTGALQAACWSFLTGSASSLGRMKTRELRRKLKRDVRLRFEADVDFPRLLATAAKSLRDVGPDVDRCLELAGCDFSLEVC